VTIFDMLDRLEAEITALRAQAGEDGKGAPARTRTKRPKKKKTKTKISPVTEQEADAPAAAINGQSTAAVPIQVGKRQALGRSLLQLRKGQGSTPGPH
jgi:hypothetical protein